MEINKIYNEDCFETLKRMENNFIDLVLTSPPYNTVRNISGENQYSFSKRDARYDGYKDNRTPVQYIDWMIDLFNLFDSKIKENGIVLFNLSYCSDSHQNWEIQCLEWLVIAGIIKSTNWSVVDRIVWKKKNALLNNRSPNKLTRICEDIFVFARKNEIQTFSANKEIASTFMNNSKIQNSYKNYFNLVEAKNNDGPCPLNNATYSSDLCKQLLKLYAKENSIVYDPFMGSGTTGVACKQLNMNYIGSEISAKQVEWAENRIKEQCSQNLLFEE